MEKLFKIRYLFIILLFITCKNDNSTVLIQNFGNTQGTYYHIKYISSNGVDFESQIDSILLEIDSSLSTYNDYSLISNINNGKKTKVDFMLNDVFNAAKIVYIASDKYFDCTISPLTDYWGFGSSENPKIVDSNYVNQLLDYVSFSKVDIIRDSIKLPNNMKLDFNAIAQGYSVDLISDFFESRGITRYLIEIGGEIRCSGRNAENEIWLVGISKPNEDISKMDEFQLIIPLKNASLATSGNYRNFREINGVRYSHSIDPKTGYFANNRMLSVSVIHESCMMADAFATAFMVMGVKKTKDYIKKNPNSRIYFVYSDRKGNVSTFSSENFQ
tara:strand:+ start:25690 stop:26679 length:990 start_codon:yes stop_codon:yes gene_type:complete